MAQPPQETTERSSTVLHQDYNQTSEFIRRLKANVVVPLGAETVLRLWCRGPQLYW